MANDPKYDAVIGLAKVHLERAWAAFCDDPTLNWRELPGDVPKARARAWVDALQAALVHAEEMERRLSIS